MLEPLLNPSDVWLTRDDKHDLAFRPLETALLGGGVDAIYTQSKPFQHLQEATGKIKAIGGPLPAPGLDHRGRQDPGRHHVHRRDGRGASRSSS